MARETTCSKESDKELTEDCEINLLGVRSSATLYLFPAYLLDVLNVFKWFMNSTVLSFGFCFHG